MMQQLNDVMDVFRNIKIEDKPIKRYSYYILILAIVSLPIFLSKYPHILDFPGHLARVKILSAYSDSDFYHGVYQINNDLTPNIAFDFFVYLFHKFLPLLIAGKLFLFASFAITVSGCAFLHAMLFRNRSFIPLLSSLFLYNLIFHFGFINYLLGVGMMLWGAGIWLWLQSHKKSARFIIGLIISGVIFFTHIIAFVLFSSIVGAIEIERLFANYKNNRPSLGDFIFSIMPLFIPILYFFFFISNTADSTDIYYVGILQKIKWAALNISWDGGFIDLLSFFAIIALIILVLLRGKILFSRKMVFPSIVLALLLFIIPTGYVGGSYLDIRLPIALLYVLLASCNVSFKSPSVRHFTVFFVLFIVALKSVLILKDWKSYDTQVSKIVNQVSKLPQSSTLFLASGMLSYPSPQPLGNIHWKRPLYHVASYAVLHKALFIPDIWAEKNQHSIVMKEAYEKLYEVQRNVAFLVKSKKELKLLIKKIKDLHLALYKNDINVNPPSLFLLLLDPNGLDASDFSDIIIESCSSRFLLIKIY